MARKLSISQLAKAQCRTVPKMKALLIQAGIVDPSTNLPYAEVIQSGRAEIITTENNRYGSGPATFAVYDADIVDGVAAMPSLVDQLSHCTSRHTAESRLNELVDAIGELFNVVEAAGYGGNADQPDDAGIARLQQLGFDHADIQVFVECHFSDPHFCGGPGWAAYTRSLEASAQGFLSHTSNIRKIARQHEKAAPYVEAIERVCDWLSRQR